MTPTIPTGATGGVIVPDVAQTRTTGADTRAKPVSPQDVLRLQSAALQQLCKAQNSGFSGQAALKSAAGKISVCASALASAGGLESAMCKLLEVQGKQTDQQVRASEGSIRDKFKKLQVEAERQRKAIQQRIEAEKDKGFWDRFVGIFRDVGTCVSAVAAAVCSGGTLGCVAAALMIASVVVSHTKKDQTGMWISVGLSAAGGMMAAGGGAAGKVADKLAQEGLAAAEVGAGVAKGVAEKRSLEAEADLLEIRAVKARLVSDAEQEREMLKTAIEAQNRGVNVVLKAMSNNHQVRETVTAV
jgi:hypothetical protein